MPLSRIPSYPNKNDLRPNPGKPLIDPERDTLRYIMGSVVHGDFGGDGASASRTPGLPTAGGKNSQKELRNE
jgi:hypothetical protein